VSCRPIDFVVRVLDLRGTDDNPSFTKITWWAVFIAALATRHFGISFGLLLGAWAFGRSTMLAFINRSSLSLADVTQRNITSRRDAKEGIDPSP
jgi:hypothetical protein